jgi:hypothetical protein
VGYQVQRALAALLGQQVSQAHRALLVILVVKVHKVFLAQQSRKEPRVQLVLQVQ